MATQVLLKKDVHSLGDKGQIVSVKPGYARNYLLPKGFGIIADKRALRLQVILQKEREEQAAIDTQHSQEIATCINGITVVKVVKVDHEGHMYGSVSVADILHLIQDEAKIEIEKRYIQLKHPIKTTGVHVIHFKLKEGITATCNLKIISEEDHRVAQNVETPA